MQKSDEEGNTRILLYASCQKHCDNEVGSAPELTQPCAGLEIEVGLLTGGMDRHYAVSLAMALVSKGVCLDFIGWSPGETSTELEICLDDPPHGLATRKARERGSTKGQRCCR